MAAAQSIVLIGAGRMGGALASGWLSGRSKPSISIVAPRPTPQVQEWAEAGRITLNPDPSPARIVVLGIKPQQFTRAAESIKQYIDERTLVISVMGGIKLSQLEDRLGTPHVIRAMPNTPGSVGKGVTLLSAASSLGSVDIETARKLLTPLGLVEGPMDEKTMVAATGISGCGPAYVFLLAEVMAEAGEGEAEPVDRLGFGQREEVKADRDHRDRHQRDDLDRHAPAREGNEHRDGNAHRGDCMVGRNPDHPAQEIPVYPVMCKALVWYPWPDSNRHFKETRF